MKILHTSDWHLGKSLYDFSLLDDQREFIQWLLELLEREPVDAVILSGDIYDRPVPPSGAVALYDHFLSRAVGELGIPVLAIAGNHDSPERLQFGSRLYRKSGYYIVGSLPGALTPVRLEDEFGPVQFTLIPYLHPADVRALFPGEAVRTYDDAYRVLLSHLRPAPGARSVAVAHGFFSGLGGAFDPLLTSDSEVSIGGMDIADSSCFSGYDYAALGHLHAPQRAGDAARYSGSPLKYSLSEERQNKSVTLVNLGKPGEPVMAKTLPVPASRALRAVSGTMEQLLEPSYHQNKAFGDYVFADISGEECLYPMQKLRTLFPRLLGLRFLGSCEGEAPVLAHAGQAVARQSTRDLFIRFYRESTGGDLPPEYLELVDETLGELQREEALV